MVQKNPQNTKNKLGKHCQLDQWSAFLKLASRPYYGNSGPATKWKLEMTAPIETVTVHSHYNLEIVNYTKCENALIRAL